MRTAAAIDAGIPLIVLAEDDPDDRLLIGEAFAETGSTVELLMLPDGEALIECLRGGGAHAARLSGRCAALVICDINMPRRNGLEAIRALREAGDCVGVPMVTLTSSRRDEERERAAQAGADAHYVKPSSFDELVEVARRMLEAHVFVRGRMRDA